MAIAGDASPASDALYCSEPGCAAADALPCSYVDRRQRACPTAWCHGHRQIAFNTSYCRRHAGIIALCHSRAGWVVTFRVGDSHRRLRRPNLIR
jgi:hypothetical protein